jgi:hypothetical protein
VHLVYSLDGTNLPASESADLIFFSDTEVTKRSKIAKSAEKYALTVRQRQNNGDKNTQVDEEIPSFDQKTLNFAIKYVWDPDLATRIAVNTARSILHMLTDSLPKHIPRRSRPRRKGDPIGSHQLLNFHTTKRTHLYPTRIGITHNFLPKSRTPDILTISPQAFWITDN